MTRLLKRRLALGVAIAAVLGGGTAVALGATGGSAHQHRHHHARAARAQRASLLSAASAYLGIGIPQLRQELATGKTLAQIASATSGHSEAGLIAALLAVREAHLKQLSANAAGQITSLVNRPGERAGTQARHGGAVRAATLSYLGLTREQLSARLQGGKSLAEVADSIPGKSSAGLLSAMLAAASSKLHDSSPAAGTGKAAQAARLAKLRTRVTTLIERPRGAARKA